MLILLLFIGNILTCVAHSTMTCVNKEGSTCKIEVRKNPFYFDVSPRCCSQGTATEAVKCPDPAGSKGTIAAGSKFTVEWPARNHATPSQDPDGGITKGVSIYIAPAAATTLGDYCGSATVNENCPNKICDASYGPTTCEGGTNGDNVPCTVECTMPANKPEGKYNILWLWDWRHNDGSMYSACGDITVTGASNTPAITAAPTTAAPTTPPPTTLPPTELGVTRPPTEPPTEPAPNSCNTQEIDNSLLDNQIKFINLPKEIPYRACSIFLQEVFYKKDSNTLGMLIIDIVDAKEVWHGKGVEIIPGKISGRTTVVMHIWEGKPLITEDGPFVLKAYFVEKSSYDEKFEAGDYWKDQLAVDTTVESAPICAGCDYYRHCGEAVENTCSVYVSDSTCPTLDSFPTECPVDQNMKPVAIMNDNSAIRNLGTIGIFFSALFVLYSL